jgi:hypothetical protein
MYKLQKNLAGVVNSVSIQTETTCTNIPFDPDNTDYQQYLKWVEEGNTPLPADEGAA